MRRPHSNRPTEIKLWSFVASGKAKWSRKVKGFSWRRNRLESKLAKLEVKEPVISICLGSRRLFHAQYNLEVNGYSSHEDWLVDWRASSSDHFTVIGSKDETAGCQNCVLMPQDAQDDSTYSLRLTMPPALVTEHGKHLVLTGLRFSYGTGDVQILLGSK
jgi:hypothetical protein